MSTLTIGYGRASSDDQSTVIQSEQLQGAGCSIVLTENASGTKRDGREKLDLALGMLKAHPGSTLVVTKLDRLARNVKDAIGILEEIEGAKAGLRVLDIGIETATPHGRMLFHVLTSLAQWETELRRERQAAGIEKAKRAGVYKGSSKKLEPQAIADLKQRHAAGVSLATLAREFAVNKATVCRYLKA